ncbi:MAG: hypothetical protein IJP38_07960 [Oscillospiraceae bacterium]|nr:hypothetical protein [Oscillospiraceae bacterium]
MHIKKAICLLLAVAITSLALFFLAWGSIFLGGCFSNKPSKPKIVYHEFPICLEYEVNGKYTKVEDIVVCKFDGFAFNEGNGKFRRWIAYLRSGNSRITLFKEDDIEIYYFPIKEDSRLPGVLMGDAEFYTGGIGGTFPDAWITTNYDDKTVNDYLISKDELLDKYKIRLISWECAPPIKNIFKE